MKQKIAENKVGNKPGKPADDQVENETKPGKSADDQGKEAKDSKAEEKISDTPADQPSSKKSKKSKKNKKSGNHAESKSTADAAESQAVAENAADRSPSVGAEISHVKITEKEPVKLLGSSDKTLSDGLKTTRTQGFLARIGQIFKGQLNPSVESDLEEILFTADIGVQTSERLLERVTDNLRDKADGEAAMALLKSEVYSILKTCEQPFVIGDEKPHVILTLGVNGAGKTTTLGKMAAQLTSQGKKVLLIAGDTFRAAAIEQLDEWAKRCGCEIFSNKQGADPSGTIFDGIRYAKEHGFDVALADTAGRLHNKKELIEELKKINRVSGKAMEGAPHQVLLVLDATNGQNALMQAKEFGEAIPFSGIVLTKLDGTAKGGVIIGICEELKKPVYFIGIGEMIDDLRPFVADQFVEALFHKES